MISDRLKIEGSNVLSVDTPAINGVIHVLENVIEIDKKDVDINDIDAIVKKWNFRQICLKKDKK